MKKHKQKRKEKVPRPRPTPSVLGVGPMVDEALLEEATGKRAKERRPTGKAAEHSAQAEGGEVRKKLQELWNWLFETEIHSPMETRARMVILLIPLLVALLAAEVLIPGLFALLFG